MSDVEPGTPYLGWFSNDVEGEFSSVEIASRYGVYVLAADWFSNLTVFREPSRSSSWRKHLHSRRLRTKFM